MNRAQCIDKIYDLAAQHHGKLNESPKTLALPLKVGKEFKLTMHMMLRDPIYLHPEQFLSGKDVLNKVFHEAGIDSRQGLFNKLSQFNLSKTTQHRLFYCLLQGVTTFIAAAREAIPADQEALLEKYHLSPGDLAEFMTAMDIEPETDEVRNRRTAALMSIAEGTYMKDLRPLIVVLDKVGLFAKGLQLAQQECKEPGQGGAGL